MTLIRKQAGPGEKKKKKKKTEQEEMRCYSCKVIVCIPCFNIFSKAREEIYTVSALSTTGPSTPIGFIEPMPPNIRPAIIDTILSFLFFL